MLVMLLPLPVLGTLASLRGTTVAIVGRGGAVIGALAWRAAASAVMLGGVRWPLRLLRHVGSGGTIASACVCRMGVAADCTA